MYVPNPVRCTHLDVVSKGKVAQGSNAPYRDEDARHAADHQPLKVLRPLHGPLCVVVGFCVEFEAGAFCQYTSQIRYYSLPPKCQTEPTDLDRQHERHALEAHGHRPEEEPAVVVVEKLDVGRGSIPSQDDAGPGDAGEEAHKDEHVGDQVGRGEVLYVTRFGRARVQSNLVILAACMRRTRRRRPVVVVVAPLTFICRSRERGM